MSTNTIKHHQRWEDIKAIGEVAAKEQPVLEMCMEGLPRSYNGKNLFRWHHEEVRVEGAGRGGASGYSVSCKVCCASVTVTPEELEGMRLKVLETRQHLQEETPVDETKLVQLIALKNLLSIREFQTAMINLANGKPPYPKPPIRVADILKRQEPKKPEPFSLEWFEDDGSDQ